MFKLILLIATAGQPTMPVAVIDGGSVDSATWKSIAECNKAGQAAANNIMGMAPEEVVAEFIQQYTTIGWTCVPVSDW